MAKKLRKWVRLLVASVFAAGHSAQASSCEYLPGICSNQVPEIAKEHPETSDGTIVTWRGVQQVGVTQQRPPGVVIMDTQSPFKRWYRPMSSYMVNAQQLHPPEVPPGVFINS